LWQFMTCILEITYEQVLQVYFEAAATLCKMLMNCKSRDWMEPA
jgi:hypothetical protein